MFGHTERFTRHELYDLVWSTPAMTLAARFKLSGNGLAKLCARHNIPVPERGYWQRKVAGHSPKQPPLPPVKHELLERVEIYVKGDPKEWLTGDETRACSPSMPPMYQFRPAPSTSVHRSSADCCPGAPRRSSQ